jgi:AraC-like DNA-binding protein
MSNPHKKAPFGNSNELYFFNVAESALGRLLAGGSGTKGQLNNWWNVEHAKQTANNYYLVMMLEGSAGFYNNEKGFECPLEYGDFFIAFPGQKHRYAPGEAEVWNELCVGFEGEVFDRLQNAALLSPQTPVWHLETPLPWITELKAMLRAPRPTTALGLARETAQYVVFLLKMLEAATPKSSEHALSDWFEQACIMLSTNLSHPPDLKKIALELGLNYETFRRNFQRRAGLPPGKYFDEMRCKEACKRLSETQSPCWEIAHYLGFCDEQHFSRRFKAWKGLSPRNYRIKHTKTSK